MKKRWGCLFTLLIIVGGLFWGLQSDKPIQSHEQLAQVAPSVAPLTTAAQQVLHQAALGASDASVAVRWDEQEALTVLRHLLGHHDTLLKGRYQLQDDYVLATVPVTFWGVSTQVSMRLKPKIEGDTLVWQVRKVFVGRIPMISQVALGVAQYYLPETLQADGDSIDVPLNQWAALIRDVRVENGQLVTEWSVSEDSLFRLLELVPNE